MYSTQDNHAILRVLFYTLISFAAYRKKLDGYA